MVSYRFLMVVEAVKSEIVEYLSSGKRRHIFWGGPPRFKNGIRLSLWLSPFNAGLSCPWYWHSLLSSLCIVVKYPLDGTGIQFHVSMQEKKVADSELFLLSLIVLSSCATFPNAFYKGKAI